MPRHTVLFEISVVQTDLTIPDQYFVRTILFELFACCVHRIQPTSNQRTAHPATSTNSSLAPCFQDKIIDCPRAFGLVDSCVSRLSHKFPSTRKCRVRPLFPRWTIKRTKAHMGHGRHHSYLSPSSCVVTSCETLSNFNAS